jgi:hypothetical protein
LLDGFRMALRSISGFEFALRVQLLAAFGSNSIAFNKSGSACVIRSKRSPAAGRGKSNKDLGENLGEVIRFARGRGVRFPMECHALPLRSPPKR